MAISDDTHGLTPDPAAGTIVATGLRSHPPHDRAPFARIVAVGLMRDGVARIRTARRATEAFPPCRGQGPEAGAARIAPELSGADLR